MLQFCLRKDRCDRSRKYTLLIIITTRRCVILVEQEGKGGVPGLSLLAFFSSFLVHISVVILVAEGSARSKSEGEIIDHHRQKKNCLFFIYLFPSLVEEE